MRYIILCLILTAGVAHAQDAVWVRNGFTPNGHFGSSVLPLGDQNDDGNADWAVVSYYWPDGSPLLDDRFDVFLGGDPPSTTPHLTFLSRQNPTVYMIYRRVLGDVNGDGYIDWAISYWQPGTDSLLISLYGGGVTSDTVPEVTFSMPYDPGEDFIGSIGDHNGDGKSDFFYYKRDLDLTYIFWGSEAWDTIPDLTNHGEPIGSGNSIPSYDVFGDFNGDGFDDYLVHTIIGNIDSTLAYYGSSEPDTIPDQMWQGNFALPATLSADVNSDGAADLIVSRVQSIDIHLGSNTPSFLPTFILNWPGCSDGSANYVRTAGDYNRDGYEDFIGISDGCANGFGALQLYLGGPWLNPNPVLRIEGLSSPPFDRVEIWRAVGIGDINGDGVDDLAIGCQGEVLDGRRGSVVILSGDTSLVVPVDERLPIVQDFSLSVFPNPVNGVATIRIEQPLVSATNNLTIYNILGKTVNQFTLPSGSQSLAYDVSALPSGIYIVQAKSNSISATQKLVVLK